MKHHFKQTLNLLLVVLIGISISCEKIESDYSNEDIIIKSQEIQGYIFKTNNCNNDSTMIVPCKLYVKGGIPKHDKGDYHFKITQGSTIPGGLIMDTLTGVIRPDNDIINVTPGSYPFDIEVSDGNKTTVSQCVYKVQYQESDRFVLPAFQFISPATNFIFNKGSEYFAVSFSVMGGVPPYYFSLAEKHKLPGKLSLNPVTGVIAGNIDKLETGEYPFQIQCVDARGSTAISFNTSRNYEDFILVIK